MRDRTLRRASQAAMQGALDVVEEEQWRAGGEEVAPE